MLDCMGRGTSAGPLEVGMKIALDGSLLGARFSGVERSIALLLRHLPAAAGDRHHFVVFVGDAFDEYVERYGAEGLDERLEIVRAGIDNRRRAARIAWQQVVLPRLVHACGADVFHGPGYLAPAAMPVATVVTLYDLLAFDHPEFCERYNRLHYRLALPAGLRRARKVIVPSAATRRSVARWFPAVYEDTVVVPLGVERRFAGPQDPELDVRERYRLPERYLLWVGNVEPKKNVGVLLAALAELRGQGVSVPTLVIAGQLSWGTNELMRRFLALGLEHHVVFLGRVEDAHLPALYREAAAFCFPSLAEGFGLPPLEAMAAGTPVVVSDRGALPEVVGNAGLVVPAEDVAGWAAAIVRVLEDEALRASLRARGRARALAYSWERTASATVRVYEEAAQLGGEDDYDHATGQFLHAAD